MTLIKNIYLWKTIKILLPEWHSNLVNTLQTVFLDGVFFFFLIELGRNKTL